MAIPRGLPGMFRDWAVTLYNDIVASRAASAAIVTQINALRVDLAEVRTRHNATDTAANAGGSQAAALTSAASVAAPNAVTTTLD